MKQDEYWNSVSEKKDFATPFQAEAFSKFVKRNSHILDVGCGYGRTLDELYHKVCFLFSKVREKTRKYF